MKLEELKKPARFISYNVTVNEKPHIAITKETCDELLGDLIGLRVEAAHAMGMLRGYRMAMKDIKQNLNDDVCFDFPTKD